MANTNDPSDTESTPFHTAKLKATYPHYKQQLLATRTQSEQHADTVAADTVLPPEIANCLENDLYSHQAEALDRLTDGENVSVATSTSSGKTWVYTLYYALRKHRNPDARALFLYPTKALSADQEQAVNNLFKQIGLDATAETYDGDTPGDRRPIIRDRADVVISNFAGINAYLNTHVKWRDIFSNCELLVIDESHTYTGIHGMHVSWIVRRLRRILEYYGATPQIVCSTATIGNPKAHPETLTGSEFSVVDADGSPRGKREIAFWQPPIDSDDSHSDIDTQDAIPSMRVNANKEAASLLAHLGLNDVQTLQFTRSRQETEFGAKQAIAAAKRNPQQGYLDVDPYHAGLSKSKRRATENNLKSGSLDGVLTTSALELGIDIGSVDATILAGYPGTRQSFWQQIGRAGRNSSEALSVFVPRSDAIDQYILDHPEYLLGDNIEDAVVDLSNNAVYAQHILCAGAERPLTRDDATWFGSEDRLERAVQMWKDAGQMTGDLDRGAQYDGPPRPQGTISMYATTDEQYRVRRVDGDIDMEPLDKERVYREYHPGALTLYDGTQYEVVDVVEETPRPYVEVEQVQTNTYTQTLSDKRVHNLEIERSRDLGDGYRLCAGMGDVDVHYHSYKEIDINTGKAVGMPTSTGLDPISLRTQLMWVEFPPTIGDRVIREIPSETLLSPPEDSPMGAEEWTLGGGLHGGEHGMIKMSPLELRLDNSDMGGLSTLTHPEVDSPVWFIHDAVEGGVGFSHSIYDNFTAVAERTIERVEECDCDRPEGCPSCLMSSQCGNENEPLHRPATSVLLNAVLGQFSEDT
ncbi:DEAD/DEAH box helicase [Halovenus marina]|uniref:DEAD/DEAH box helicase n=1 Tax=Halovenus marina TaxID=3396621 RepID=UPI003F5519A4